MDVLLGFVLLGGSGFGRCRVCWVREPGWFMGSPDEVVAVLLVVSVDRL